MKSFLAILAICLAVSACAKEVNKEDEKTRAQRLLQQGHLFIEAVVGNDIAEVKKLLGNGFDVNYQYEDGEGQTPLHWAVFENRPKMIELLASRGADINAKDDAGRTPLYKAVFKKHTESLKMLLEKGADPNVANNGGLTPLHLAASTGCSELAEMLLDKGAKVNVKDGKGRTPLDILQDDYPFILTAVMVRHGAARKKRPADIIEASRYGEVREVQQFISTGVDVNAKDEHHAAALHYAVQLGDLALCELLIDAGADVDIRSNYGTPLLIAAGTGNMSILELLVSSGADVNSSDNGWMPLHGAAFKGHLEAAKNLLSQGAKPNNVDDTGKTALDYAVRSKNTELEKLFRSYGAKTREELAREQEEPGRDRSAEQR